MTRTSISMAAVVTFSLVACGGGKPAPSDAHTNAGSAAPDASQSATAPAPATPEACHVFTLVRPPTVQTKKVASLVLNGDKPTSLAILTKEGGEIVSTTVAEIEATMCKVLPPKPYLVHMMKEKGKIVAEVTTPTAAPDEASDARVLCDAKREGARLGVAEEEQLSTGLTQAAGSLTTRKYRDLLFGANQGDEKVTMELVKSLDKDIRAQGNEAFDRCTVLVKK